MTDRIFVAAEPFDDSGELEIILIPYLAVAPFEVIDIVKFEVGKLLVIEQISCGAQCIGVEPYIPSR